MFFQSPRPFGQHSTSYRSMSNSVHSSSSMTSLQMPESKSGRASVPPISFAPICDGSRLGSFEPAVDRTSISNTSFEQMRISKDSSLVEVVKNMEGDRPNIVSSSGTSTVGFKNYEKQKAVLSHDSCGLSGTSGHDLKIFQQEVRIPISRSNVCQKLPPWTAQKRPLELHSEQTLRTFSPYPREHHRSITTSENNRFRSDSTVPCAEYARTGGHADMHESTHGREGFFETRVSSSAPFNASQVPFNEQQQKAITYQQLERRRNYATLHHIASPKIGPLQRRTDPNLIKINGNDLPENVAMFNVAKGVRAELEQDPKFRRKANILSRTVTEPIASGPIISPLKEQPKQSPSLRQMENFFDQTVPKFHNVVDSEGTPLVASGKLCNLEDVRSIFRRNAVCTESPSVDTSIPTNTQLKSLVEMHETQEKMTDARLKGDGTQTSGTIGAHMVGTSQSTQSASGIGKLVEQAVYSASETSETNRKFIADKPVIASGIDKNAEMRTPSQGRSVASHDIATLEKDYDSSTTFVAARPLNQPFPVNDIAFVSAGEKSRNAAGPPGILMKDGDGNSMRSVKDSGIKTPKKVAFQCDRDSTGFIKDKVEKSKTSGETPLSIVQYDDAVDGPLQRLLKLSADIGGDLQTVGNKLSTLFTEQRNFIWLAAGQKEPSINELQSVLSPLVKLMEDLSVFKESKRNTPFFNHISAASEGIQALGWLTVKPTPAPFIKDMLEASMFFVNRVLKEWKDDKIHTEWAKSWSEVLNALKKYVQQVHTTGLVWNSCPGAKPPALVKQVSISSGGAPPPPPPPVLPPDLFATVSPKTTVSTDKSDRAALFAEINAGEKITERLKKVTPDMQTHKNPALRSQQKEVGSGTRSKETMLTATGITSLVKDQDKPPKTWLNNGKQWNLEYYKNNNSVVVEVSDMKQTVYVFKCENSVIQIKGKVNSVTLDSCKKTSVIFDSLLSQLEVINCQSVQIQTLGAMPTLSIQKTDGCQVYLSKSAINAEIITSKSSEMNVLVPGAEDGDFVEFAVPEQFKTVYDGKKLKTTVSDIC
ncbi:unnamed protein product [Litomosoides sigmodontis]|uniref:C-CAP/cofactor C-like domain-containing protein n=1 Tax=Litomosoides sigmodontis TaxID=42156 RepID=A0A3P6VDK4_LITSI|nr:unnamed protein product [Litomosoides sigmodontis]